MKEQSSGSSTHGLNVSIELLAAAIESAKDSIVITDMKLDEPGPTIVYVNDTFIKMTGYKVEEVIGKSPRILQGPETDRNVLDDLRNRLSNNKVFNGKTVNYRKDGSSFINEWHVEPIIGEGNQLNYYLAIQRDVTEQDRIHKDKLHQKSIALKEKSGAISQLLQQIEQEKQRVKEDVISNIALNIEAILLPTIRKLKCNNNQIDNTFLTVLENGLRDINASFGRNLVEKNFGLSSREIEIAALIRQGLSTKAIALSLDISSGTVELQRKKIRKKLGIANTKENLMHFLQRL